MAFFSFKTYSYRIFWLELEISASELTHVPNVSSIGKKIREPEFWPWTIPKMAWWRHTYLLVMTSANFLRILRDFVPEYHHAKFCCNWTTNKEETEEGTLCPPAYMVSKDLSMNRVKRKGTNARLQQNNQSNVVPSLTSLSAYKGMSWNGDIKPLLPSRNTTEYSICRNMKVLHMATGANSHDPDWSEHCNGTSGRDEVSNFSRFFRSSILVRNFWGANC